MRLAIGNIVEVPVKFSVDDAGKPRAFSVTLLAKRLPAAMLHDAMNDTTRTVADFLRENVTGWRDQSLVLDEAGAPAPFSLDALDVLLSLAGVAGLALAAYLEACGAKGKAKN